MQIDNSKLEQLVTKQDVAFLGSIGPDGFPYLKAMLPPRKHVGLKEFYFTTNTSSMRVAQYRQNPNACLYFYHKGLARYQGVMLKGTVKVLEDAPTKEMLWRPGDQMFYKLGVTDPDYCVLKFTSISGRYYCDLETDDFSV